MKRNSKTKTQSLVKTNIGERLRIGTNEWGKALVACPQCNEPAVVDATQTIWCRACGYTSAGIAGCG